jgi:hypothetical protein
MVDIDLISVSIRRTDDEQHGIGRARSPNDSKRINLQIADILVLKLDENDISESMILILIFNE